MMQEAFQNHFFQNHEHLTIEGWQSAAGLQANCKVVLSLALDMF